MSRWDNKGYLTLLTRKAKCDECGTEFEYSVSIDHWPYVDEKPAKTFCSYKCMQQYRRRRQETKRKLRDSQKNVKVTDQTRKRIFDDFVHGMSLSDLADYYNVAVSTIESALECERINRRIQNDKD